MTDVHSNGMPLPYAFDDANRALVVLITKDGRQEFSYTEWKWITDGVKTGWANEVRRIAAQREDVCKKK